MKPLNNKRNIGDENERKQFIKKIKASKKKHLKILFDFFQSPSFGKDLKLKLLTQF
jgi:hypothetical protein